MLLSKLEDFIVALRPGLVPGDCMYAQYLHCGNQHVWVLSIAVNCSVLAPPRPKTWLTEVA